MKLSWFLIQHLTECKTSARNGGSMHAKGGQIKTFRQSHCISASGGAKRPPVFRVVLFPGLLSFWSLAVCKIRGGRPDILWHQCLWIMKVLKFFLFYVQTFNPLPEPSWRTVASFPGSRAWYTLFAHAQDFGEFGHFSNICCITLTTTRYADFSYIQYLPLTMLCVAKDCRRHSALCLQELSILCLF